MKPERRFSLNPSLYLALLMAGLCLLLVATLPARLTRAQADVPAPLLPAQLSATPTASATAEGGLLFAAADVVSEPLASTATPTRTPTPVNFGNFVWDDLDQDGRQDAGEPGLANVTVQLWNSGKTSLLDQDVTNASGNYTVTSSGPGNYRIRVVLPSSSDQFSPKDMAGGDDTDDSDVNPSGSNLGFTDIYAVASNVISISNIDIGIIKFRTATPTRTPTPVNFGNFVWDDLDQDGRQDAGEPGLANVTVQLWNSAKSALLDQDVTNASGNYTLQSAGPGNYRIRVVLPSVSDQFSPKDMAGGDDTDDSDVNPSGGDIGFTDVYAVASNVISISSIDIGIIKFRTATPTRTPTPVNIGNFVWNDLDEDGIQDAGEPGLAGVTVQLWNSSKSSLLYEDVTDANGLYTVIAPTPGSYYVRALKLSNGDSFSPLDAGADDTKDSDVNPFGENAGYTNLISIASNVISTTKIDIGMIPSTPVTIGDWVWIDENGDGFQQTGRGGEPGVPGRRISLRVDSLIDYTVASATTSSGGFFTVTAPEAGTYYLCITTLSGETFTTKSATDRDFGTDDGAIDSDINPTGSRTGCTDNFEVTANTTRYDIGFAIAAASVVGNVDMEGRGTAPDARWALPHRLVIATNAGVYVANTTVTTDTNGRFVFGAVQTGSYKVWVKGEQTLAQLAITTLGQGGTTIDFGLMRAGDANDDNVVNISDFSILAASFGKASGTSGYDERADFNGSAVVDITDFSLLAVNFGQAGETQP